MMLTVSFDHKGIVHYEYRPDSQAINKAYYVEALHWLRDAVWRNNMHCGSKVTGSCTMTMPMLSHLTLPRTP